MKNTLFFSFVSLLLLSLAAVRIQEASDAKQAAAMAVYTDDVRH